MSQGGTHNWHLPLELQTYFLTFYNIKKTTVSERINHHSCGVDIHRFLGAFCVYAICAASGKWDSQSAVQAVQVCHKLELAWPVETVTSPRRAPPDTGVSRGKS